MLKMKLPIRTAEEEGDDTAEDEQEQTKHIPRSVSPSSFERPRECSGEGYPFRLTKETVFEWFGLHLNSAKRIEFMYGLLHMCQPLELRFLGSCLEDLARKDYYVLRDCEIRANSPNDMGLLSNVIDPVMRSKLLVYLSLLGSDNRECAGILFRILSHVDPALCYKNYGLPISSFRDPQFLPFHPPCEDGDEYGRSEQGCRPLMDTGAGLLEQLALLFTMASLHPAFPFHQRETLHGQLEKVELAIDEQTKLQNKQSTNTQNKTLRSEYLSSVTEADDTERSQTLLTPQSPPRRTPRKAVHIEKIVLKGISRTRSDREYSFEVKWSDSTSSKVTKTHLELESFLLKLPKEQSTESFEKGILHLLNQGEKYEQREVERNLKETFLSAPPAFRQTGQVCGFFLTDCSSSSSNSCSKCNPVLLGKAFKEDCSEASSQEEDSEPYIQGHRKKPSSKSPSLSVPNSRGAVPCDARRRQQQSSTELNGLPEWRRKGNNTHKPNTEPAQQHVDDRRSSSTKTKSRAPPHVREKGKKDEGQVSVVANGISTSPATTRGRPSEGKDVCADAFSGQDTYGETSSESYSSPPSPQHDGHESLDSEDEKDRGAQRPVPPALSSRDTDSHSDDSAKVCVEPLVLREGAGPSAVASRPALVLGKQLGPALSPDCPMGPVEFPPMPFPVHPVSYVLHNGADVAAVPGLPTGMLPSSATVPQAGEMPPDVSPLPGFGLSGLPMSPSLQPQVHRFKTGPGPQAAADSGGGGPSASHQPPVGAISTPTHTHAHTHSPAAPPAYTSPFQPAYPACPDAAPLGSMGLSADPHTKPPAMGLAPGLPSYGPPIPTSVIPSMGPGAAGSPHTASANQVAAVVPTHTPGPAPSLSPALTHSTAQSESTSYINSSTQQQQQQQQQQQPPPTMQQQQPPPPPAQQQQPMGCGACGCRGSCGGNGSSNMGSGGGGHMPSYYFHQMAPTRQVFTHQMPPHLFPLSSLCSGSYLSQGAPQGTNAPGQQLSFFPSGPGTATATYPGGALLHTHAHTHAHTHGHTHGHTHSEHVLGGQAAAAAAAAVASYGFQQMAAFRGFYPQVYPMGHVQAAGGGMALAGVGGINKKNGVISCYNCGVTGHIAQDCKQPPIDATQQGGFRLKYMAVHSSEALDNSEG
ncbi:zinc finger CCHC domain-containing protein 2-like isoform X1 [Alosa sapidissima]|uniref:zinc finger CCHC domain-containing protein 2-like isoform X1 n=1 Tax=Alosa sapidissima TaxID=34773 RepID=UPI001C094CC0|nr:zinc finger CCHC domain-containing protein 2-like isoform X1 [Alosa sapidissima]